MGGDAGLAGQGQPGLPAPHHVPQVLRRILRLEWRQRPLSPGNFLP